VSTSMGASEDAIIGGMVWPTVAIFIVCQEIAARRALESLSRCAPSLVSLRREFCLVRGICGLIWRVQEGC
jgi:hypothetical protein